MRANQLRVAGKVVVAGLLVLLGGSVGYMAIEKVSFFDALYMTTITVTTVGFEEVFPLSRAGRTFTMVISLAGVAVILVVASEVARVVLEADLRRVFGLRREGSMTDGLEDHIVVCGHGRMGRAVVEALRERRVPFVVVDSEPARLEGIEKEGVPTVRGDATQERTLLAAEVKSARTFIACLRDDAHNVFSILLARQLNPRITIIARAVEDESEERLRLAGANKVINPYRLGGTRLAYTALKPTVMDFLEASLPGTSEDLELAEMVVQPGSELAGKTLAGAAVRKRFGIIVVALKREGSSLFNPDPDVRIEANDVLVVLGPLHALERTEEALS